MLPRLYPTPLFLPCLLLAVPLAHAQDAVGHSIVQPEPVSAGTLHIESNVRTEYAEVLRVEAIRLPLPSGEQPAQCLPAATQAIPETRATSTHNRTRSNTDNNNENIVLSLDSGTRRSTNATSSPADAATECTASEQVVYDVDYVLRGVKYRSRLPYDPGNRVRIQLSVTPLVPPEELPPPAF